jgi:hypothetical protein
MSAAVLGSTCSERSLGLELYEILFGITSSLPLNRARAASNRIGLVSKNIFWKIDFSVVFIVSFPENTISVFVFGVALT